MRCAAFMREIFRLISCHEAITGDTAAFANRLSCYDIERHAMSDAMPLRRHVALDTLFAASDLMPCRLRYADGTPLPASLPRRSFYCAALPPMLMPFIAITHRCH